MRKKYSFLFFGSLTDRRTTRVIRFCGTRK